MRSLIILAILATASFAISKPVPVESLCVSAAIRQQQRLAFPVSTLASSGAPSLTLTRRLQNSNTQAVPDTGFSLLPAVTVFSTRSFPDVFDPSITLSIPFSLIRASKSIVFTPSQITIPMLPTPSLVPISSIHSSNSISPTDAGADLTSGLSTASQSTSSLAGPPTPSDDPSRKKSQHFPPGAIGGVVAGAILLLVSVAIAFCIWRGRATRTIADAHSAARPYYTAQESALAGEHAVRSPPPLLPHEAQPQDKPEVLHEESSLVPHDPSSSPHVLPPSSPELIGPTIDIINHERQLSGQHTSSTNNTINAGELEGPRDVPLQAIVDPSALSGLVERITRAILLDSRLGHAMGVAEPARDSQEAPPGYQE